MVARSKDYKAKLKTMIQHTAQVQAVYETQQGLVDSQAKFIHDVMQVCKVQTCAQAVEYLTDIHRKADFFQRCVALRGESDSVRDTWRWVKQLYSDAIKLNRDLQHIIVAVYGADIKPDNLLQTITHIKTEAEVLRQVRQSGILGPNIEATVHSFN